MAPRGSGERAARAGALLALWLGLGGCRGGPAEDEVVVELWALGREGEVVAAMVPEFERRHPGIRVRVQQVPWSAAHEKLLTAYVGEAMPDVFQVGNTWIPELVALGALEPLDERLAASAAVARGDYFPGILDTNVIDGRLFGLPWYVDTRLLFYRRDLLEASGHAAPPRTWDEWRGAMRDVKHGGAERWGVLLPLNEWQTPVILALQRGARLLRDGDTRGDFRDPRFRAALAFYVSLFDEGLAPRAGASLVANVYQEFARGTFSFWVTGPWNLGELDRRLPGPLRDAWATAPMPASNGDPPGTSVAGGASLAAFRGTPRKDAAWKLIEHLSTVEAQLDLYRRTGDLPPRRSAWEAGALARAPRAQAFWTQLEHVTPTPKVPEWERIAATVARRAEEAIRGRLDVDAAVAALDADVDRILEKRRWMLRRAAGRGGG